MPASEETWRSQLLLHRIFAVSGVGLLLATLWMFGADHFREWKPYQRNMVKVDTTLSSLLEEQYQTSANVQERAQLEKQLVAAKAAAIDETHLKEFQDAVQADIQLRGKGSAYNFNSLDEQVAEQQELAAEAAEKRAAADKLSAQVAKAELDAAAAQAALAQSTPDKKPDVEGKLKTAQAALKTAQDEARAAESEAAAAEETAGDERAEIIDALNAIIRDARFREDLALNNRKIAAAELDATKAAEGIMIRDGLDTGAAKAKIDDLSKNFGKLTLTYQDAAAHRKKLQGIVNKITADQDAAAAKIKANDSTKKLLDLEAARKSRQSTYFVGEFPYLGKRILELPILDAFGSPRRPENLWSEGLTINYSSSYVRRFDRCTTCHQAMDKTAPDSATDPAYVKERFVELVLATPAEADIKPEDKLGDGASVDEKLLKVYGLRLTDEGLLKANDVTVSLAMPGQLAAKAALAPTAARTTPVPGDDLRRALLQGSHGSSAESESSGLLVGDVIVQVNDDTITDKSQFQRLVLGPSVKWGAPLRLKVRRGLPHPYVSHPRLDLFVGSLSPHKMQTFGCTICHDGQGSATAFKWASHTPNDPEQRKVWTRKYGWFDNHHWIYPQSPQRFLESGCLKCHHNVTELEPSERFPDPPAPKVVHGHDLMRKYGCFGCHEVNGYDGPNKRVGPDLRLEPTFYAVAEELLTHLPARREIFEPQLAEVQKELEPLRSLAKKKLDLDEAKKKVTDSKLTDEEKKAQTDPIDADLAKTDEEIARLKEDLKDSLADSAGLQAHVSRLEEAGRLAERLVRYPEEDEVRRRVRQLLEVDRTGKEDKFGRTFGANSHRLSDLLKDIEVPGTLRKSGPSLRHASAKLDPAFLVDWIKEPKHFRPSTRMPQFFGLTSHLDANQVASTTQKEQIEILAISAYLLDRSQKFEYLAPTAPAEAGEDAKQDDAEQEATRKNDQIARGKQQFQSRGCLACHNHQEFPEAQSFRPQDEIVQGPDLSGLSAKFSADRNSNGRKWLYSWIKQPSRYHARTVMPDLFLDTEHELPGKVVGTDPADDIVEYLLSVNYEGWQPAKVDVEDGQFKLDAQSRNLLRDLTRDNLKETFFEKAAERYLTEGIPESMRGELKGAEVELVGEKIGDKQWLLYMGRKSIGKYGCYGCHDVPGFEDAKPIGTGLADWGRKEPAKLAFEHIAQYLHGHGGGHDKDDAEHAKEGHAEHGADQHVEPLPPFYEEQLMGGSRIGFIFQKLREPRSYDYHKVENKRYNERLRMPQFPFSDEEREAVVTFVLGLVAEPPTPKYIYVPNERSKALAEGRQVLEKYNCGGCHVLEMDKWKIAFTPKEEGPPPAEDLTKVYPFLRSLLPPAQIEASQKVDRRGLLRTTLSALPSLRGQPGDDGLPEMYDSEGDQVTEDSEYAPNTVRAALDLWQPALLNGREKPVGGTALQVPIREIEKHYPSRGGMLAKYLVQPVFQHQKSLDSSAKIAESWGWLPPPLLGEGAKVQSEWLHDFLLDPHPIRPAVVLRMPKFNMSPEEATKLVNYFAAVDNADYPYEFGERRRESHLTTAENQYQKLVDGIEAEGPSGESRTRMNDALKVVTNVCVKCHLVGDYAPGGTALVKGPNLSQVDRRLKASYLRDWIADPKRILPYTGMPVNVPFDETAPNYGTNVSQDLYHGNSLQQLDGLVDLLANFDEYTKDRTSIKPLVKVEATPASAEPPKTEE